MASAATNVDPRAEALRVREQAAIARAAKDLEMEQVRAQRRAEIIAASSPEFKAALLNSQRVRAEADEKRRLKDIEMAAVRAKANENRLKKAAG
jgi:hypothetical protein